MRLFIMFFIMLTTIAFAETPKINSDGKVEIAGERVKCEDVRIRLDNKLDNLGVSYPEERIIIINPRELSYFEGAVQLFVWAHECGHIIQDGGSEVDADCFAVKKGIDDGWLTRKTMMWVCRSFGNEPANDVYPSGVRRCALAQFCYAKYKKERHERKVREANE